MSEIMKNIIKNTLCILMMSGLLSIGFAASAQVKIKGTVKDAAGEPVPGAAVMLEGSVSIAEITDDNGYYEITIPEPDKSKALNVSCIGFKTIVEKIGTRAVMDFVMQEDMDNLDEAVVIGYGSMRKSDLTGAVASVKINDEEAGRVNSLDQLLLGKASGVQVLSNSAAPDAGISIRIRGLSSLNGSSEPLYVVDGIILNSPTTNESLLTQASGGITSESINGLLGINPQDIERIEILKDASATAIYGALGANGVVLITTKTASRERPVIRFNAGVDVASRYKKMPMLTFDEYVDYLVDKKDTKYIGQIYEDPATRTGLKVEPMDWQDYLMRTAVSQRYYLSISGKPDKTAYSFSLGYSKKEGIVKETGVDQFTGRLNLDRQLAKWIKIGTKTSFAYISSNMTQGASAHMLSNTSMMRSMLMYHPYKVLYATPEEEDSPDLPDDVKAGPDKWLTDFVNKRQEYRITPSIYGEIKFTDWLKFKSSFGGDFRNSVRTKYKTARLNNGSVGNTGAIGTFKYLNWNWDNTLLVDKTWGNHTISGMVGTSMFKGFVTNQTVEGWNIDQYKAMEQSLNTSPNSTNTYLESDSATMSYFARLVYNFKERYILTGTYRIDGSSRFQGANKWAQFPSFAFAWRLSNENWFNVDAISNAKLRIGWGRVGNQTCASYQTMKNYSKTDTPSHDPGNAAESFVAVIPTNISNPSLKWETAEQWNAGLDLSFWSGRLSFSAEVYQKVIKDLLQSKRIASSSGFSTMWLNEGSILNKGLEFTLDATPVKTKQFEWNLNANISFNRNSIISINPDAEKGEIFLNDGSKVSVVYYTGATVGGGSYATAPGNIFMEGYPMGLFYGYKTDGLVQEGQTGPPYTEGGEPVQPGGIKYIDMNGNGYIDNNDRAIIGDPNPDFLFGFSTDFRYRRFTLSMIFNGSYGNDILNLNRIIDTDVKSTSHNVLRDAYFQAWTPEHPQNAYPALDRLCESDYAKITDRCLEDGSYLRMSSLSLDYNWPIKKNNKFIKGLNLALAASNLFIITKYSGWDPEVNSYGTDLSKMGIDSGAYPTSRVFSFDVKFTF